MKYWTKVVMDRLALHDLVEGCRTGEEEEESSTGVLLDFFFCLKCGTCFGCNTSTSHHQVLVTNICLYERKTIIIVRINSTG